MKRFKHIVTICTALFVAAITTYLCCIGYGYGHIALNTQSYTTLPSSSHLSVLYERTHCNHTDFLKLEIDTTYRAIGKGKFVYEVICDRDITLKDNILSHNILTNNAAECFIIGGSRKWYCNEARRDILQHECLYASSLDGSSVWESWYSDALPHISPNTRATDGYKGLILELRNIEMQYSLKAVNISHTI